MKRVRIHAVLLPFWRPCIVAFDADEEQAERAKDAVGVINLLARQVVLEVRVA